MKNLRAQAVAYLENVSGRKQNTKISLGVKYVGNEFHHYEFNCKHVVSPPTSAPLTSDSLSLPFFTNDYVYVDAAKKLHLCTKQLSPSNFLYCSLVSIIYSLALANITEI